MYLVLSLEAVDDVWVVSQVGLVAHKDDGDSLAKVFHLFGPLLANIVQGVRSAKWNQSFFTYSVQSKKISFIDDKKVCTQSHKNGFEDSFE